MNVLSDHAWSPQKFVEAITGNTYTIDGDDDVGLVAHLLETNGYSDLWDYPLSEVEHIIEHGYNVVLVDCLVWSEKKGQFVHEYRWWEVPDDKIDYFQNN
jgi:hypothetical protein